MKSYLLILIFGIFSISTKAQSYFLGKKEKVVRDSMFKANYKKFEGQVENLDNYIVGYSYDELQDPSFEKKLQASPNGILPIKDSISYAFTFNHDTCVSSQINHANVLDYQKVVSDLNAHYKKRANSKNIWLDNSGQIEIELRFFEYSKTNFYVKYRKVS